MTPLCSGCQEEIAAGELFRAERGEEGYWALRHDRCMKQDVFSNMKLFKMNDARAWVVTKDFAFTPISEVAS